MLEDIKIGYCARLIAKIASFPLLALLVACVCPALVQAQTNLLCNAGLTAGSGDTPQCWSHDALTQPPGDVTFEWLQDEDRPELEVYNYEPVDSRWKQTLHLKPGWYHFTGGVRTENVGELSVGANLSIMETWYRSRDVKGTSYWETIGFYLKIQTETDVVLACRLGGYDSENTGRVFFRNLSATQVAAPAGDDPSFTLQSWDRPKN
jgi:hypothetical protein